MGTFSLDMKVSARTGCAAGASHCLPAAGTLLGRDVALPPPPGRRVPPPPDAAPSGRRAAGTSRCLRREEEPRRAACPCCPHRRLESWGVVVVRTSRLPLLPTPALGVVGRGGDCLDLLPPLTSPRPLASPHLASPRLKVCLDPMPLPALLRPATCSGSVGASIRRPRSSNR